MADITILPEDQKIFSMGTKALFLKIGKRLSQCQIEIAPPFGMIARIPHLIDIRIIETGFIDPSPGWFHNPFPEKFTLMIAGNPVLYRHISAFFRDGKAFLIPKHPRPLDRPVADPRKLRFKRMLEVTLLRIRATKTMRKRKNDQTIPQSVGPVNELRQRVCRKLPYSPPTLQNANIA